MNEIRLAMLGVPEVRCADTLLTFRTRKALALLIYLAVEREMHPRAFLSTLFWPERDAEHGRMMLRTTLAHLRQAWGAVSARVLRIEGDRLGLAEGIVLDLATLDAAFQAAVATPSTSPELIGQLQSAVMAYRGDFLTNFALHDAPTYDAWAAIQREHWHRRAMRIFDRLTQAQAAGGELDAALDTVVHWLALDPLNEVAHRQRIRLHVAAGDRHAALRAIAACQTVLADELGIAPSIETIALAERVRSSAWAGVQAPRGTTLAVGTSVVLSPPLVGRAGELAQLMELLHTAQHGSAGIAVLTGEAGIGKTSLAHAFLRWAALEGSDVLHGRAFETSGRLPYQSLIEPLRARLERERAPDDLLDDAWLAELSRLLPELRERYPDLALPIADAATAHTRLFEAVARLCVALAKRAPLVLFVDDIHWADLASRDLIDYLVRGWVNQATPALLLLGVRAEARAADPMLANWLADLNRTLPAVEIALEPLTADATVRLVQALAGMQPTGDMPSPAGDTREAERFGTWLFTETAGQPFYLIETLKELVARAVVQLRIDPEGQAVFDAAQLPRDIRVLQGTLPSGVRALIRARLRHLTPVAAALLAAGAVLGHGFSFDQLCRVVGHDEIAGLAALDELLGQRLLRASDPPWPAGTRSTTTSGRLASTTITYEFTHDKIRDVVYTEAGETRRQVLHRRAFTFLETQGVAADLARHALAGGLAEAGLRLSMEAGDVAMRLLGVHDAVAHYEQARSVLESGVLAAEPNLGAHHQAVYTRLGRAYEISGARTAARDQYMALLAAARHAADPAAECVALNRLATLAARDPADIQTPAMFLREALQVAERSADRIGLAETSWNLAQFSFYRADIATAQTHGIQALNLARELGQPELIMRSLNLLAYIEDERMAWAATKQYAEEAYEYAVTLGDQAMQADCLGLLAKSHICTGRSHDGVSAARTAYELCRASGNPWGQTSSALHLAMGLVEIAALDEALDVAGTAVALAQAHEITTIYSLTLLTLGNVQRAMGEYQTAQDTHEQALANDAQMIAQPFKATIAGALCADCVLAGEWATARDYAHVALDHAAPQLHFYDGFHHARLIEALLAGDEVERAAEEVERFGAHIGANPRLHIVYLQSLAALADWRGSAQLRLE
jgi:predicted ATPase/DNA-binding SARP family transcriptional activator